MSPDAVSPAFLALVLLAAVVAATVVAVAGYHLLGLAKHRYEVESGLAQLAQISWHELQVLIGLGLRGRGLGAVGGDHEDVSGATSDLLLSDGDNLQLLRVKHGAGIQVDEHTVFDLATRRDARRAKRAMLATTGRVHKLAATAARSADIAIIAGADLWNLVNGHLPSRLRERIANRRRAVLRTRIGLLVGSSALAATLAVALSIQLARSGLFVPSSTDTPVALAPPIAEDTPDEVPDQPAAVAERPPSAATPAPAPIATPPPAPARQEPLDEAGLQAQRQAAATAVRQFPEVQSVRWSTASTIEVVLRANANLQDDQLFVRVCDQLRNTEELRLSRVQLELAGGDPSKAPSARWRQCR